MMAVPTFYYEIKSQAAENLTEGLSTNKYNEVR
ncbi:hypothetical protein BH23PAT1_BH23PAT1_2930 [soil metagenome]